MKKQSRYFDSYKIFGISTLVIYGLSFLFFLFCQIFFDGYHYSYDDLVLVTLLCCFICALYSVIWFLVTLIWCIVIAIKQKSIRIFFHPMVITNLVIMVYCTVSVVCYFINRRMS